MSDCKETPVQFGPDGSLIGIVSTPSECSLEPVACLMLNMGANHRIGPRRINVKLARQMAQRGIASIRFDLAGLGDSGAASGAEHFLTQAVFDLQAAMNLIETMLGVRRFIVIGLCSGAASGMSLAVTDARVIGLLMFDGYVPEPTLALGTHLEPRRRRTEQSGGDRQDSALASAPVFRQGCRRGAPTSSTPSLRRSRLRRFAAR
ncbi:MAG: hypothetical protein WKG52_16285 [Variovorax sp.]